MFGGLSYPIIVYPKLSPFGPGLLHWYCRYNCVGPKLFAIVALKSHENANALILSLLVFVWGLIQVAFFIGKLMGHQTLSSGESRKTWSGCLGGDCSFCFKFVGIFLFDEIHTLFRDTYFFVLFALLVAGISVR